MLTSQSKNQGFTLITLRDVIGDGATVAEIIATNCYLSYDSYLLVPEAPVTRVITTGC
ncbi:hypothetical protein [Ferrimonas aestuarii]|uniref:hypothetical protein n=1 Tax=Ferrimonas aestuarii TaxID=2569539 RepID=UPI00145DDAF0|nr:hypothetical protein [Ferrimonas aestuarii]